jgi:ankyrin repeat protein
MVKALVALGLEHPDALTYAESSTSPTGPETADFLRNLKKQANPDDPAFFWNRYDITTDDVRRYIAAGGDVNYATGCPTPLQRMAERGEPEAVELLLKHGADPTKRGHLHNSAVFLCMSTFGARNEERALSILQKFIEHGISPNTREYAYGMQPPEKVPSAAPLVLFAISQGYFECARYLLEKGADPTLKDGFTGEDAFDALRKAKSIEDAKRLEFRLFMEQCVKGTSSRPPAAVPVPAEKKSRSF